MPSNNLKVEEKSSNTMKKKERSEAAKALGATGGKATFKKLGKEGMRALSRQGVKAREAKKKIKSNDQR
jgi:hypothetical protein